MDPGTILAVTSLALQGIDLLLKSISKIEETGRSMAERKERLRYWRCQLSFCSFQIETWFALWGKFDESTYLIFWGNRTYTEIQAALPDIGALVEGIEKIIGGRGENHASVQLPDSELPTTIDWGKWQSMDFARYRKDIRKRKLDGGEQKFFSKISFALFSDHNLQGQFDRLQNRLQWLETVSRAKFQTLRRKDTSRIIERAELRRIDKSQKCLQSVTALADSLFIKTESEASHYRWSLELREPGPYGNAQHMDSMATLDLDFAIQTFDHHIWQSGRRLRVQYGPSSKEDADIVVARLIASLSVSERPIHTTARLIDAFTSELQKPTQLSLPFRVLTERGVFGRPNTLQAWAEDQACLLRGFVHWMLILWQTKWTKEPCCCCIRFQSILGAGRRYIFSHSADEYCKSLHSSSRKLVAFGVTLSEIITTIPFRASWDSGENNENYTLESWNLQNKKWRVVSREEIFQSVWSSSSIKVAEAVSHCLDPDLWMDEASSHFPDFYVEHILGPLDEYSDLVIKHRREFENTAWWRIFTNAAFGSDWPPIDVLERQPIVAANTNIPGAYI